MRLGGTEADAPRAHRIAEVTCLLGLTGLSFDALRQRMLGGPTSLQLASMACLGATLLVLVQRRPRPGILLGNVATLVANAAIIACITVTSRRFADVGEPWALFRPNQLGAMTVALLAPPAAWVGIASILGFTGAAVVQYALLGPEIQAHLRFAEPWASLAYGGFAVALYVFRLHGQDIERALVRAQAESAVYERVARTTMAVRDLANTPLQTLMLAVTLLKRNPAADVRANADRIERAVARLTELDRMLSVHEASVRWRPGDESLDAAAILSPKPAEPKVPRRRPS